MTDEAFPREIARTSDRLVDLLREAGALAGLEEDAAPKFYLACDQSVEVLCEDIAKPNRRPLEGMAAHDIKAAICVLRQSNDGFMKGPYHLEDAAGEQIFTVIPAHGRRNWDDGGYTGQCGSCGHAFLGPKRAPMCAPCWQEAQQSLCAEPDASLNLTQRLERKGDELCLAASAEIVRLRAEIDGLKAGGAGASYREHPKPLTGLCVDNSAQSEMIAGDPDCEIGAGYMPAARKRSGVYMASKAVAHGPRWQKLRETFPVISTWIDECAPGATLDWPDLWARCLAEATSAEVLIVYMEPGETLKGAWVEVGAALAAGVPVIGVGIDEFSIAKSGKILLCKTIEEAVETARGIMDGNAIVADMQEGNHV